MYSIAPNKGSTLYGLVGRGGISVVWRKAYWGSFPAFVHDTSNHEDSEVADAVASPQTNPEGRIELFGGVDFVCDQQVVGTWVFVIDPDRALLDAWTNEFKLDGETLDTVRTPNKRNPSFGDWWFAEGVPVLGVLDPGVHTVEFTYDDGFGGVFTFTTLVDVSASNC